MSVSFSGLQRGSLNIPHRQGEEEGKLINIITESSANRQQGEGMSGLRRNWEGVRLPYAFFPPPFAREGGRERAQDGRRESKCVQEREVYGTVSFLATDITELEYVLETARTFCPTETRRFDKELDGPREFSPGVKSQAVKCCLESQRLTQRGWKWIIWWVCLLFSLLRERFKLVILNALGKYI